MRSTEQDVQISAIALQKPLIRPRIGGAAAMKIDVRRDNRPREPLLLPFATSRPGPSAEVKYPSS